MVRLTAAWRWASVPFQQAKDALSGLVIEVMGSGSRVIHAVELVRQRPAPCIERCGNRGSPTTDTSRC
jgi:hypothetical protein